MSHAKSKGRRNGASQPGKTAAARGSAGRLIVTYVDGTWTDNLAVDRYVVEPGRSELVLNLEVRPRERPGKVLAAREALRVFIAKLGRVHTLQIGKPLVAAHLRDCLRGLEHASVGVKLSAGGRGCAYPANLAFGPDEITLNLG